MSSMSLKLLLVGDIMLGRLINNILNTKPPMYPWGDTLPIFQDADVRVCNLECAITDRDIAWSATPKAFHFRTDTKNVAVLRAAHINAVSLANNHILDFEYEGLFDTVQVLKQAGIHAAGAGATLREASEPAIWEERGLKLGFIACTDNEPIWASSMIRPGVWYIPTRLPDERAHDLFEVVRRTKVEVACLIVSLHWGPNWGEVPPPEHRQMAHALIDHGADIVYGHSCHVVQGIEVYKNRPIIYGAGDFIDDYAVDKVERNDQSAIFLIDLHGTMISRMRLYPTIIDYFQVRRARNDECKAIVTRMQRLCTQMNTATIWNEQEACLEVKINITPDTV